MPKEGPLGYKWREESGARPAGLAYRPGVQGECRSPCRTARCQWESVPWESSEVVIRDALAAQNFEIKA